jgi:glycosyltransferase involved in cell wall biosynthesis
MMRLTQRRPVEPQRPVEAPVDVCLIVEGCYPFVPGGVSSWVDWLMRTQPQLTFSVIAIVAGNEPRQVRYRPPPNLIGRHDVVLHDIRRTPGVIGRRRGAEHADALAGTLTRFVRGGGLDELAELVGIVNAPGHELSLEELLDSRQALAVVRAMYDALMPHASFLQFYWAWRALFGGLFATLRTELPPARVYHAISTGYAGLLAARAAIETGRPCVVTEHGIYTNERRIEILMAEWISRSVDSGVDLDDVRMDLRELWIATFESYARACYQACSAITTLYRDNQAMQVPLGADPAKLRVIANGIDADALAALPFASEYARPTMALIGRVVPIKDTKSFIVAAAAVRRERPDLRALVMGPTDEDPAYVAECRQLIADLQLEDCVELTGAVRIADWLPKVHVVVLTSLSEAQPLVPLEAGAAGVPCVATGVGACREIIEGAGTPEDPHEAGGFVTPLVSPDHIAARVLDLVRNPLLARRMGEALRRRVLAHYTTAIARARYEQLYRELSPSVGTHSEGGAS